MTIHTLGGFVEPGKTLLNIVPADEELLIEAFFANGDIGFLEQGQRAYIRFDAFPPKRYGIVYATVINVAASANQEQNKETFGTY
ncbi:HlyD family efflux transporter periplasmic adaptor subunit [Bartonella sp. DGB2]|uniref:HlyD family efflux transporter periplasmic adaptor subunit n=1 Tax=Bartonella sp. DGB2 TaxID=3388426 RepID=UPI00398FB3EE